MLIEKIGEPATLELLAEECIELAHACLKLARVMRGENPTPKTEEECKAKVIEEVADVSICMEELDTPWLSQALIEKKSDEKYLRMVGRLINIDRRPSFGGSMTNVVRCWACENYSPEGTCDILCGVKMKRDDFCSYGRLAE